MSQITNQQLFEAVAGWLAANYPGEVCDGLLIRLRDRKRGVSLPLPFTVNRGGGVGAAAFEPTPFQLGILDALAGKALRVDALVAVVKDRPKLYRDPGGVKELERHGLVKHDKRRGYYRPDAPPDDLDAEAD